MSRGVSRGVSFRASVGRSRLAPLLRGGRKKVKRAGAVLSVRRLRRLTAKGKHPLTGDGPAVVSLTSHGRRVSDVAITIESIGAGRVRPSRLILWLDDERLFATLPTAIRAQMERGLEVRLSDNYGPHTKYFPYVRSLARHTLPLVTADDDIIYPSGWLAGLLEAHHEHPDLVSCYRAHVVGWEGDRLAPYNSWVRARDTLATTSRFATGVSGVIYPPEMLDDLAERGDAFRATCPRADDIWLHWVALRSGRLVRQLSPTPQHFPVIPGSQADALMNHNVDSGGNDEQLRALYDESDVALVRRAAS
jgi:hypothetical protein